MFPYLAERASHAVIGAALVLLLANVSFTTIGFAFIAGGCLAGYVGLFLGGRANRRLDRIAKAQKQEIADRVPGSEELATDGD